MNKSNIVWILFSGLVLFGLYTIMSNESSNEKQVSTLVNRYCGSCHHVPNPGALTPKMWEKGIFPRMADYFKWTSKSRFNYANKRFYAQTGTIAMTDTVWALLQDYFVSGGLEQPHIRIEEWQNQTAFDSKSISTITGGRGVSAIEIDEFHKSVLVGYDSIMYRIDQKGAISNSINTNGLISDILPDADGEYISIVDPGVLDPHDASFGSIKSINSFSKIEIVEDSLRRPVYLNWHEDQILVSEYGNVSGGLTLLNADGRSSLSNLPGAYKTFVFDYDKDGEDEVVGMFAQALEGIYVKEIDDTKKRMTPVLSFNPEWGISDIDTADINNDGWTDLVIVNGDNADYSIMTKDYHGVRVYINNKDGRFEESFAYPLHGATQVKCLDADGDGLIDILCSAFFSVDRRNSLVLLSQEAHGANLKFDPSGFSGATEGRWMVMDTGDVDGDGDIDAVVGAFEYINLGQTQKTDDSAQTNLLILLNRTN